MSHDRGTVDGVVSALYESRSHRRGGRPDWDRFRSLFIPSAQLVQLDPRGGGDYVWNDLETYIAEHEDIGLPPAEFHQVEIERRVDASGGIAHIFSRYRQYFEHEQRVSDSSGVNSFHLVRWEDGWRITVWVWEEGSEQQAMRRSPRIGEA